jgi:hypothetical protein
MRKWMSKSKSGKLYAIQKQRMETKEMDHLPQKKKLERQRYQREMIASMEKAE